MANKLYQYSIINALMDGAASGGIELRQLQLYGTHGLGAFENINGEMVMIDGVCYHLKADGSVHSAPLDAKLPFAMVTRFKSTTSRTVSLPDKDSISAIVKDMFPKANNLYLALKVEATFRSIKVRMVRGQSYKGQPLSELGDKQAVKTYHNVTGTIFGFRSPAFAEGISVAGGHLHFLSADRDGGGHVLELEASVAVIDGSAITSLQIEFPDSDEFNDATLESDREGISKIEG